MERTTVEAGPASLVVRTAGSGVALLCLHAIGHGARDFDRLADRLSDRFRVVAPDWPGHGESPAAGIPPDAASYAALLQALFDRLGLVRAIVLGNSIGGAAAIHFAAQNPARVDGLVLCDSGGLVPLNPITRFVIRRQARRFARGAAGDPDFPRWYADYYAKLLREPAADWRRGEIVAERRRMAPILAQAWSRFAVPEADIRSLMPQLAMPVLYAWGRRDPAIPWALSRRAAESARDFTVELFDCGHCPFLECPEAFDRALIEFAERVDPRV